MSNLTISFDGESWMARDEMGSSFLLDDFPVIDAPDAGGPDTGLIDSERIDSVASGSEHGDAGTTAMDAHTVTQDEQEPGDALIPTDCDSEPALPILPDGAVVQQLWLPAEMLICRTFSLPLAHPRFVDSEILAQELEERSCEDPGVWWPAWQAVNFNDGVSGLMVAMPESLRSRIAADAQWQSVAHVGVDLWGRLQARLHQQRDLVTSLESGSAIAVFDSDSEGVCIGCRIVLPDEPGGGFWAGMRRLNVSGTNGECGEAMAAMILHSLSAMGWSADGDRALGLLSEPLLRAINLNQWLGETVLSEALPTRHEANLALGTEERAAEMALDFRHGIWRVDSQLIDLKPWRRTLWLAAGVTLIWMIGMLWQNQQLSRLIEAEQRYIEAAFHQGLPDQKVMIDPLAQLRKAAGVHAGSGHTPAGDWLRQVAAIHQVYRKIPWQTGKLSFAQGEMTLSGKAADLQRLNQIRDALQQQTGKHVKLIDTDLSGNAVSFRMSWS